ncbi:MAG TPA: uroporphyrinogen-III C-methyltransferase [Candidatus Acidoferrales bacterium]
MSDANHESMRASKVYLVGAGPGDAELLTLRAVRVLASAHFVLHDALVSAEVLAIAAENAVLENVGKRCGERVIRQEQIHARMIELARAGFSVVRLQGGDPAIFGRAGEEISALARAGVKWEIVPGITAASAAAAAAGISLTDRRTAGQLIFLAGHRASDGAALEIPGPPPGGATVAIHMPATSYAEIVREFLNSGWCAETPCILVSEAASVRQRVLQSTIGSLGNCDRLPSPSILIVGATARASEFVLGEIENEIAAREIIAASA